MSQRQLISDIGASFTPGHDLLPGAWQTAFEKNEMPSGEGELKLLKQIAERDRICAVWLVSVVSRLSHSAGEVLSLPMLFSMLEETMPEVVAEYRSFTRDKQAEKDAP